MDLSCNGSGNTALDCDGTYSNNGGDVTTNDGSESDPGSMGGNMGGNMGGGMGGNMDGGMGGSMGGKDGMGPVRGGS